MTEIRQRYGQHGASNRPIDEMQMEVVEPVDLGEPWGEVRPVVGHYLLEPV